MKKLTELPIGIYEKAMNRTLSWKEKIDLAREYAYNFIEISIDESEERLSRLDSSRKSRLELRTLFYDSEMPLYSICLSGNRRYPLGSSDRVVREKGMDIIRKAIDYGIDLGVRNIQIAGYDVYYETSSAMSGELFYHNLEKVVKYAEERCVMLSIEIMDHPFMDSVEKFLGLKARVPSPWLQLYPDIGNLSAWNVDIERQLVGAATSVVAVHLKDSEKVTESHPGKFREVPFGSGCVDFVLAFKVLNSIGYQGPFLVEMWGEDSRDHSHLGKARSWLQKRMEEAHLQYKP